MAKGPNAFRTISEAAEEVGAPQHVLRFWESKFAFIQPVKRAGGRRFYRPQDVAVLQGVRRLLHDEGLTIKGVQRLHKEHGLARIAAGVLNQNPALDAAPPPRMAEELRASPLDLSGLLARIEGARDRLAATLHR